MPGKERKQTNSSNLTVIQDKILKTLFLTDSRVHVNLFLWLQPGGRAINFVINLFKKKHWWNKKKRMEMLIFFHLLLDILNMKHFQLNWNHVEHTGRHRHCCPAAGSGEHFIAYKRERTLKTNDRSSKTPIKFTLVSEQGPLKTSLNRLAWSLSLAWYLCEKRKESFLSCSIMMKTRCNDVTTVLLPVLFFFFMLGAVTYVAIVVFMSHSRMPTS